MILHVLRGQYTEKTSGCHKTEYFKHCKKINKRTLGLELKTKPDSLIIKWQWLDWNMDSKFQMLMQSRALKCQDWIWNLKEVDKQNVITEWKI